MSDEAIYANDDSTIELEVRDDSIRDPRGGVWWPHEDCDSAKDVRAAYLAGNGVGQGTGDWVQ